MGAAAGPRGLSGGERCGPGVLRRGSRAAASGAGDPGCNPAPAGTSLAGEGRAAVLAPTYGEYGLVLRRAGIGVDEVGALGEIGPQHRLAVVVNPNNPDGRTVRRGELLALAEDIGRRGGHLVVDEAFADADPDESVAGEAGRAEGLVVFRSFGKFFGLAGMRLGFVLATETVRARFERALGPWAVAGPALAVSTPLMRDASVRRRLTASIAERHAAMRAVLDGAGLTVIGGTVAVSPRSRGRCAKPA